MQSCVIMSGERKFQEDNHSWCQHCDTPCLPEHDKLYAQHGWEEPGVFLHLWCKGRKIHQVCECFILYLFHHKFNYQVTGVKEDWRWQEWPWENKGLLHNGLPLKNIIFRGRIVTNQWQRGNWAELVRIILNSGDKFPMKLWCYVSGRV